MNRAAQREAFIKNYGWPTAAITPLASDASFRHYYRVRQGQERAILMDAPPDKEQTWPFVKIATYLSEQGLSPPRVLQHDAALGFILLEDLGDATFTRVLAQQQTMEEALYTAALDVLLHLQHTPYQPDLCPAYDEALLLKEVMLMPQWLWHGQNVPVEELCATWQATWQALLPLCVLPKNKRVLVLRDYHVDNLMHLPARNGVQACGLLDFQDAVWGHPAYDLVSLLHDARRDVPEALQAQLYQRFVTNTENDTADFHEAYTLLGLQRACKIVGIFHRLDYRDGKPQYRQHVPRVWKLIARYNTQPIAKPIALWFEQWQEFLPS